MGWWKGREHRVAIDQKNRTPETSALGVKVKQQGK
eukprot:CAMPEP_0174320470 /NCGR_PEP_ID=MMETSP0810-20121108/9576_1 /TAXON_ID=73025 ORGANISM="Eutreptiella gymnastica-like, Strain CCMP1594" /NCGR_SAMPLE_ID=MMETSP0810 /ASSEMBLY_ACC=CAM_ASM_000659 /LENGTH=34 /DNA_ID= /DNA_START= /DNA_END= /DNA_ORIENTATION=